MNRSTIGPLLGTGIACRRKAAGAGYLPRSLAVCSLLALLGLLATGQPVQAEDLACLTCHSAPSFREVRSNGKEISLHVDAKLSPHQLTQDQLC